MHASAKSAFSQFALFFIFVSRQSERRARHCRAPRKKRPTSTRRHSARCGRIPLKNFDLSETAGPLVIPVLVLILLKRQALGKLNNTSPGQCLLRTRQIWACLFLITSNYRRN
jgi:hypothetical protein